MSHAQLCSTRTLGFSITTGADTFTADISSHLEVCTCGQRFTFSDGQPVDNLGDLTICSACLAIVQWHHHYRLDLTPLWLRLRDTFGWDVAREQCERAADRWGVTLGALVPYVPTPSLFMLAPLAQPTQEKTR
jgi:hypothetical protein